jgi:hypothetical protein
MQQWYALSYQFAGRGSKTDPQKMDIKMDTKEYSMRPSERSRNSLDHPQENS